MANLTDILDRTKQRDGLVVVMTGAGISAESGIPTFRGKEGYWVVGSRNFHPQQLATYAAFRQMPDEVWTWYLYRRTVCRRAAPNPAHLALVELEAGLGDRFLLITQNVDGLHIRAGNSLARTYQIHGNIDYMRCVEGCVPETFPIPASVGEKAKGDQLSAAEIAALVCPKCGARARPHVLWFDECYDEGHYRFESSLAAASQCALLVIVGTSGGTNLPNQVAQLAARSGAEIIDINPDQNPFSSLGTWIEGSAGEHLPPIARALL